jgi:hypothetical protein
MSGGAASNFRRSCGSDVHNVTCAGLAKERADPQRGQVVQTHKPQGGISQKPPRIRLPATGPHHLRKRRRRHDQARPA